MSSVGILTVINCDNNGTDIQAYAMQKLFEQFNLSVELINYRAKKWDKSILDYKFNLRTFLKFPINVFVKYTHQQFRKRYLHISPKEYFIDDLNELPYEKIIVGSDQIWNLDLTYGDIGFYLPYMNVNYEKYAYAVSLGRTNIKKWEKKYLISNYLNSFKGISVREKTAVEALKEIGIFARQDLDPVLMVDKNFWNQISVSKHQKPYILLYLVEYNDKVVDYARKLAKEEHLEIVWITDTIRFFKGIKCKRFVSVESWIGYVRNAEIVITNSYHGLAMSIVLNIPVCLVKLQENQESNARLLDLIEKLKLDDIGWKKKAMLCDYKFDWEKINSKIDELRKESTEYIQKVIMNDRQD